MLQRVLRFRVGERRWAVPLSAVREALEQPPLLAVPGSRPHVAGVLLRRGVLVPVYDLTPEASPPGLQVLVLEWGESLNGLRVSEPEAEVVLEEAESGGLGPPCRGEVRFRDGAAERLDLDQLYRMLGIPI